MRSIGLDIARCLAIILVLISHIRVFFEKFWDVQTFSINGLLGVELFFVLSGFLIGGILIRDVYEGDGSLRVFLIRRWFRTLPSYFLVLSLLVIIGALVGTPYYFQHFLFIQNFNYSQMSFFAVSWSLSIEEWFYLFIAVFIYLLSKRDEKYRRILFFSLCAFVIFGSIGVKFFYTYNYDPLWDAGIRKQIFLRMDSLMFGVLLAGIKYYFKTFYARINSFYLFLLFFLSIVIINIYYIFALDSGREAINNSIISRTVFFDFISLTFMFFIWLLDKSNIVNQIKNKYIQKAITFLAITSYSVYLIHYDIFRLFNNMTTSVSSYTLMILIVLFTLLLVYILALLMFLYWEKPIMNWRERFVKKV
ncbi:acyltransferase family protein [Paenibacillus sp. LPE1-1-1.1]|uniref:acyltransferase family protein n=1 Tax=Paenibacillus sp. LPE1-1-1.1 TaxID=3135230 RepID=UPI00341C07D9